VRRKCRGNNQYFIQAKTRFNFPNNLDMSQMNRIECTSEKSYAFQKFPAHICFTLKNLVLWIIRAKRLRLEFCMKIGKRKEERGNQI
jgi:hypothetical protein